MTEWQIVPFHQTHIREGFCCGKQAQDDFILMLAGQYQRRSLGRTYVAVRTDDQQYRIAGYYTLAGSALSFEHIPKKSARKLPRHPVPVALLGRLAVDRQAQGQGLGEALLMDALKRCLELSEQLGIHAVEVHAIDSRARTFYEHYGFVPLLDQEFHLHLPISTIRSLHEDHL